MVAAGGLFQQLQVSVQLFLVMEGDAVDAGQHLVVLVAAPVRAGLLGDLEGFQGLGVGQVRTDAHVDVLALLIEADGGVVGQITDVLHLVLFAALFHELDSFLTGKGEGLDRQVLLADLLHFLLDLFQILVGELGVAQVHVIVEAVLGGGAEGEIGVGPQTLDGLSHDMGRRVADNVQFFFLRAFLDGAVIVDDFHKCNLPVAAARGRLNKIKNASPHSNTG